MKILQSSVFRAICSIAIGCLLIKYPDNTVIWITVAIGILFLLSGIISLIVYINARKNVSEYRILDAEGRVIAGEKPTFPIVGLGSLILGCLLALTPNVFIVYESDKCPQIRKDRIRFLGVPLHYPTDRPLRDGHAHVTCQYGDAHSGLVLTALRCDRTGQLAEVPCREAQIQAVPGDR